MIRILLADDHAVVRAGLAQLLAEAGDFEVVGEAADGRQAVELAAAVRPDVVLMDLSMPVLDGIEATRAITAAAPSTRVVVLTSYSDRERVLRALDAGAAGYLLKDAEPPELFHGIRVAAAGQAPLHPRAASALLEARSQGEVGSRHGLTEREAEVLALVATGLPNGTIASRLGISEKTVKAHLTNVFRQLGVDDRTQAALWARAHGIGPAG